MEAKSQEVKVVGDMNQVILSGGNLIITDRYGNEKADFVTPNLEPYKPPLFPSLLIVPTYLNVLEKHHLIILGGSPEVNKSELARHISWQILEQKIFAGEHYNVKEWVRPIDYQKLVLEIQETGAFGKQPEPTVYILPTTDPQHFGFDIKRLRSLIGPHYIIATSESSFANWRNVQGINMIIWQELTPQIVYDNNWLAEILMQELAGETRLSHNFKNFSHPDDCLIDNISLREVAVALRTPNYITAFVQLLSSNKQTLKKEQVAMFIKVSQNIRPFLEHWYENVLTYEQQCLVIGLTLLEGLFDDQFFAAYERIVEESWQSRNPGFKLPDYQDLEKLGNFYRFEKIDASGIRIQSQLPDQRRTLIKVIWGCRRRQLLEALPVLVRLVKDSVQGRSLDYHLFGTPTRRERIRNVLEETFSDLGLVSEFEIEECLITLAADDDNEVQSVAAAAMARWPAENKGQRLVEIFENWQHENRVLGLMNRVISRQNSEELNNAQVHIRATLALAMGFAAQYEVPNHISRQQIKFFQKIVKDDNKIVREAFRKFTIPRIVPQHLARLRPYLTDVIQSADMIGDVSYGIALANLVDAEEVQRTLLSWYAQCLANRPIDINPKRKPTLREALLSTVILTYGYIQYSSSTRITIDDAYEFLYQILRQEPHPFVRHQAVFPSIKLLVNQHFNSVNDQNHNIELKRINEALLHLASEIELEERQKFVEMLKEIFLIQRQRQRGGDEVVEIKGKRYSIWFDANRRPYTGIEMLLYQWLMNEHNKSAQQIAVSAFFDFAKDFEMAEKKQILWRINKSRREVLQDIGAVGGVPGYYPKVTSREGSTTERLVCLITTTYKDKNFHKKVEGAMPEVMVNLRSNRGREVVEFVLDQWASLPDPDIQRFSILIRLTVFLVERWKRIISVLILVIFFLIIITLGVTKFLVGY